MSKIGCKHMIFQPEQTGETANAGIWLAGLVEANLTLTNASGEIYADNIQWEQEEQFASGSLATEIADLTLDKQATMFGHAYSAEDGLVKNANDTSPYGKLGYVRTLSRRGVGRIHQAVVFDRAKASESADNVSTKGSSIDYQTNPVTFNISALDNGDWVTLKEFDTEAAAISFVDTECNYSTPTP